MNNKRNILYFIKRVLQIYIVSIENPSEVTASFSKYKIQIFVI